MTSLHLDLDLAGTVAPFRRQLLKWIGNKQRFAHEIASHLPVLGNDSTYFEPFFGSGAVAATLQPRNAVGSDNFAPLIEIWSALRSSPEVVIGWYRDRWTQFKESRDPREAYESIKARYNNMPNGADLLFLCRACYGGVVRFRRKDGFMSTPMGSHVPITPSSFASRAYEWHERTRHIQFKHWDFREAFQQAREGDVIYCDPPYSYSQTILYGAQQFRIADLLDEIGHAKDRGVRVALSIDGSTTKDGLLSLPLPDEVFEREVLINVGGSMLKRFQLGGLTQIDQVQDRLLLTY